MAERYWNEANKCWQNFPPPQPEARPAWMERAMKDHPASMPQRQTFEVPNSGWQPIESAPKDGTKVLLVVRNLITGGDQQGITVGWYSSWPPMWIHGASSGPTHWMPFPPPPGE